MTTPAMAGNTAASDATAAGLEGEGKDGSGRHRHENTFTLRPQSPPLAGEPALLKLMEREETIGALQRNLDNLTRLHQVMRFDQPVETA